MRYLHIRNNTKLGGIKTHGGITVAYELFIKKLHIFFRAGIAVCAECDPYVKRTGRIAAANRFLEKTPDFYLEGSLGIDAAYADTLDGEVRGVDITKYSLPTALSRRIRRYVRVELPEIRYHANRPRKEQSSTQTDLQVEFAETSLGKASAFTESPSGT